MNNLQCLSIFDQCRDESTFVVYFNHIIESAIGYTPQIKFGPKQQDGQIFLNWPEVIVKTLGLRQVESKALTASCELYKVLFEPTDNFEFQSYWSLLFGVKRPSHKVILNFVENGGRIVCG